jgi:RNA polymerase sigma factor (sigma-70 family)
VHYLNVRTLAAEALGYTRCLVMVSVAAAVHRAESERFAALFEEHRESILRVCMRLGGGKLHFAEDVTHDVFVKLLENLPHLESQEQANIGGWLYRVAVNASLERLRRERSFVGRILRRLRGEPALSAARPDVLLEQHEDAAAALAALERLPPLENMVIRLKFLEGQRQQAIARTLGLSEGYVSKLVARGCARLRAAGWEAPDADA